MLYLHFKLTCHSGVVNCHSDAAEFRRSLQPNRSMNFAFGKQTRIFSSAEYCRRL